MKRSPSLFTSVLLVLSLVAASIAVPATADAQTINVNVDGSVRSGLVGPAGGLGDTWNTTGASTFLMTDLLDSTGGATTVDFTTSTGNQENNGWGNPALQMLRCAYFQFGHATPYNLVISDLTVGQRYDLYIASFYNNETGSLGTFTTTNAVSGGATQIADNGGGGGNGATWVEGTNYVLFEGVQPDLSNDITIGIVGDPTHRAMLSGFQLVGLLSNPAYWVGGNTTSWNASGPTNFSSTPAGTAPTLLALPPTSGYDVLFDDVTANLSTTLDTDFSVNSLVFTAGASSSVGIAQGTAGALTIGSGGLTVDSGSAAHTISAPVILGDSQVWKVNSDNANPLTVSGQISGTGMALTKAGTGTLVLSGPNTYNGATTVNAGTLTVNNGTVAQLDVPAAGTANLNAAAGALNVTGGTVNVGSGATAGTATLSAGTVDAGASALAVTGTLTTGGGFTMAYTAGGSATSFTAGGANIGDDNVARTLTLSGGELNIGKNIAMPASTIWLDASNIDGSNNSTLTNGASVATWGDKSGIGNDATQATGAAQPIYVESSSLNGQPALQFDGGDDRMQLGDLSAQFPTAATFFVVARPDDDTMYSAFGNRNNDERWRGGNWNEATPGSFRNSRANNNPASNVPTSGSHIFAFVSNSSEYLALVDGFSANGNLGANYHSGSGKDWTIGSNGSGNGADFNGDIAELVFFNTALTAEETNNVGGYLAEKYGVTSSYTGSLGAAAVDMPSTGISVTSNSTLTMEAGLNHRLGALALSGGSQLTLSGATTVSFTGLAGTGSVVGTVIIPSGGTVSPGDSIGTVSASGLTLDSGSFLTFEIENEGNLDQVIVTGTDGLTIDGGGITLLDTGAGTFSDAGTYDLIGYSGTIGGDISNLYVANKVFGRKYTIGADGSFVTLAIAEAGYWNGGAGTADWSDAANWNGISPGTNDTVIFMTAGAGGAVLNNNIGGGPFASLQFQSGAPAFTLGGNGITLNGDLGIIITNNSTATQTVNMAIALGTNGTIDAAAGDVVVGGDISGNKSLTKTGDNQLTLSGNNSYDGGTIINAGAVVVGSATGLGAAGSNLTLGGGSLDLGGTSQTVGAVSVTAAGAISNGDLTGTSYDISNADGEAVISANLLESGGIGLTKSGDGMATLSGTNTYSGLTNITAGTLKLGSAGALLANRDVTVDGTLDVNGNSLTINALNGSADGTVTNGDATAALLTISSGTFSGAIDDGSGTVALDKVSGGNLTLSGASTYTGKTSVREGTLYVQAPLTDAGVAGPLGAPTGADATIDLYNGITLRIGEATPRTDYSTDRTINLASDGEGTVTIRANDNDTNFTFGAVTATGTGAKTLDIYTGARGNGDREAMIFNGAIAEGTDPLSLQVTFRTQTGSQSYVSLKEGGTFAGPITLVRGPNVSSGYLTIGGVRTRNSNTPGSGQLGGGNYAGNISIDTNTILDFYSSANQVLSGGISGSGTIRQSGTGTLTLTGTNSANVVVTSGQLDLNSAGTTASLSPLGGTVVVGPGASVGMGNFSNAAGVLDATNPLTITNAANFAGAMVTSAGPGFTVSGEVLNPTAGSHRTITAQGGTLSVIAGADGVIGSGSGSASIDPATGVWTLVGDIGGGADDTHYWRYAELPAGDFDATVQVLTAQGGWGRVELVARDSLDRGSNWVALQESNNSAVDYLGGIDRAVGNNGTNYFTRHEASNGHPGLNAPIWLNIQKSGNDVSAYYTKDPNGTADWVQIGTAQTYSNWGAANYIGLGVANGRPITGTFGSDNIFASAIQVDLSTTDIVATTDTTLILPANGAKLGGLSLKGGSLTVTNNIALADGFTYHWEFDGGDGDKVAIDGDLDLLGDWTLELAGSAKPLGGLEYDLFTYTGAFWGSLAGIIDDSGVSWPEATINQAAGRIYLTFGQPGDADGNGVVNAADYIILKTNIGMGTGAVLADGDFDEDGDVDWADLQILQDNYGAGSPGAADTIPEPGSAILLMFGAAALLRRRRAIVDRIRR